MNDSASKNTLLFHIGRSGSRVLGDLLNQHPSLHWDNEVYVGALHAAKKQGLQHPEEDPMQLLSGRLAQSTKEVYGAEVKFFHLRLFDVTFADFIAQASALGFARFIVLKRRNFLRKIVSSLIAHQTGRWHHRSSQPAPLTPIYLNLEQVPIDWTNQSLLGHLEQFSQDFATLEAALAAMPVLHLAYEEDVLPDPVWAYRRCCQFLDISPAEVVIRYGRSNPYPLNKLLLNFDEVAQTLQATPFAWMVHEGTGL